MHKYSYRIFSAVLLVLALCLALAGCQHRAARPGAVYETAHPASPKDLVISRSKLLQTSDRVHGESASVVVSDNKKLAGQFARRLTEQLKGHGFEVNAKPSRADKLISTIILYRGQGSCEQMEENVHNGYGGSIAQLSGKGSVLLADLLVLTRRVPETNTSLRSISADNKVSSTKVRIGLYSAESHILDDRNLEEALANEIGGIAAYALGEKKHKPSLTQPIKEKVQKPSKVRKEKKADARKGKKGKQSKRKTKNRR